jgi:hypothetical protein
MSCYNPIPSRSSLEYNRRRKPENNQGCGGGRIASTCDTPSLALKDSPLYNWEQIYGKLVTTVKVELNKEGKFVQIIEKKPCPIKTKNRTYGCCSLIYKTIS